VPRGQLRDGKSAERRPGRRQEEGRREVGGS
jgi:hypothetical protein